MFYPTLFKAVEKEDFDDVKAYINGGADVNTKDSKGNTILHKAVNLENEEIVEFLIHSNARVNSLNSDSETPLQCAVKKLNLKITRLLIDAGADMYGKKNFDGTLLQLAAKDDKAYYLGKLTSNYNQTKAISIIKFLQSRGVDVKQDDGKALCNAYACGNLEVAQVLIDSGADPKGLISTGITGLHLAAIKNDVSVIDYILSHGVDVNIKKVNLSKKPLHYATDECQNDSHFNSIELLLKRGADVNSITPDNGYSPLHYLICKGKTNFKTIQLLLDYKADIKVVCRYGNNPFMTSIYYCKNFEIIRFLVDLGSDVNCVNTTNGLTPLLYAVTSGLLDVVKLFIDRGSEVNFANPITGSTALHKACSAGNIEFVEYLLKMGAKLDALDFEKKSPLFHLLKSKSENKYESFIKILKGFIKYTDVNTIDTAKNNILTNVDSDGYTWKIILEHTAKMQALDIFLHPSILNTISNNAEFNYYFNKCTKELLLAKSTKLPHSWITFFNLLVDGRRKLKNYAGNEDLVKYFEKNSCRKKFYIYGAEMQEKMAKGLNRREFYDKSMVLLSSVLPAYNPTHLIIRDILDCVTTKNLLIFCTNN